MKTLNIRQDQNIKKLRTEKNLKQKLHTKIPYKNTKTKIEK